LGHNLNPRITPQRVYRHRLVTTVRNPTQYRPSSVDLLFVPKFNSNGNADFSLVTITEHAPLSNRSV